MDRIQPFLYMHLYYHYLDWDCYLLLICNTVMALLVNEFYVRSILLGQLSLAAVSHIYVFREVMTVAKSKDSFKACFENDNIHL